MQRGTGTCVIHCVHQLFYMERRKFLVMHDPETRGIVAIYISSQQPAACLQCCCMDIDNLFETLAETKQVILC